MNHPDDDQLLLHAYGELPDHDRAATDQHLASCQECRRRFIAIEEGRAALAWGLEQRSLPRRARWIAVPLAAAAVLAAVFLVPRQAPPAPRRWQPHLAGSATAGYVTGGAELIAIDSQLTQLEHGRTYGTPGN